VKLLVDMNLSPLWISVFAQEGWEARHWSEVGDPRAPDRAIMSWAREHGYVVFTHDLDFGVLLAVTRAEGPSVVQVRAQDVTPGHLGRMVVSVLRQHQALLEAGGFVGVDEASARARILPLSR